LKKSNPNLDYDMSTIPQPQTGSTRVDFALSYAFAFPKAAKNPTGAYRAALALVDKAPVTMTATALGMVPAQRALLTPKSSDVFSPIYYPLALIAKGWLSPAPPVTDSIFAGMINDVISGRSSAGEALQKADQLLSSALSH
jgi:hypothetical protein